MKDIYIYSCINHKGFFIYKSCVWIKIFQSMVIEMLFNDKIQKKYFELNLHLKKLYTCVHHWRKFMNNFQFFHLDKLSIKYELLILKFCIMFKWSRV
jgi:hypothetical protein